jgi:hypothetical protein
MSDDTRAAFHFVQMKARDCYWRPGDVEPDPCVAKADHLTRLLAGLAHRRGRALQAREFEEFADVAARMRP